MLCVQLVCGHVDELVVIAGVWAFDNESVAIAYLWLQLTPMVGVNSLGLNFFPKSGTHLKCKRNSLKYNIYIC